MSDQQENRAENKVEAQQDEVEAHKFDQQQEGRTEDQQHDDDDVEAHKFDAPKAE